LNYASFDGRDALVEQVDAARVVWFCTCGCATVDLAVDSAQATASVAYPIPNEAIVLSDDGAEIGGALIFAALAGRPCQDSCQ
jgi:hypothetical protein